MPPRECDNDDCDYETYVDEGRGCVRWVHVPPCGGPVTFEVPTSARPGSFLDFLLQSLDEDGTRA